MTCEWCQKPADHVTKARAYTYPREPVLHGLIPGETTKGDPYGFMGIHRKVSRTVELCDACLQKLEPMSEETRCPRCKRWKPVGSFQLSGMCSDCVSVLLRQRASASRGDDRDDGDQSTGTAPLTQPEPLQGAQAATWSFHFKA